MNEIPDHALAQLLGRQLLGRDHGLAMDGVLEHIGGVNAQQPGAAALAMHNRLPEVAVADIRARIEDGRWVRANLMRGTVHLVTARQFATWRLALQPALIRAVRAFQPRLMREVDVQDIVEAGHEVLAASPHGLSRASLGQQVATRLGRDDPGALAFAARLLCALVHQDVEHPAASERIRLVPAQRVIDLPMADAAAGLDDLVRTFATAFDARKVADFTAWSGLTRMAGPLRDRGFPGQEPAGESGSPDASHPAIRPVETAVLAPYDNILFHSADRGDIFAQAKKRLIVNPATPMLGAVVDEGRFVGSWQLRAAGIELDLWEGPLSRLGQREVARLQAWTTAVGRLPR